MNLVGQRAWLNALLPGHRDGARVSGRPFSTASSDIRQRSPREKKVERAERQVDPDRIYVAAFPSGEVFGGQQTRSKQQGKEGPKNLVRVEMSKLMDQITDEVL